MSVGDEDGTEMGMEYIDHWCGMRCVFKDVATREIYSLCLRDARAQCGCVVGGRGVSVGVGAKDGGCDGTEGPPIQQSVRAPHTPPPPGPPHTHTLTPPPPAAFPSPPPPPSFNPPHPHYLIPTPHLPTFPLAMLIKLTLPPSHAPASPTDPTTP